MFIGSVIVVSHNSRCCVEACLQALASYEHWKIILVDNSSTDDTVEKARRALWNVHLLLNTQNVGFAGAVNQGVRAAEGDIFVILNPDAVSTPGALDKIAQVLEGEDVGAAGALLVEKDGAVEKGFTVRRFPTLGNMLAEVLLINRVWPANRWNRRYRCLDLDYAVLQAVEQPAGSCLAVKRKAWEETGGFDESFFPVWFEDVDFCYRLRSAGYKILYCPDAVFIHSGAHSVSKLDFRDKQSFWYRNLLRYFDKHHPRWQLVALRVGIVAGLLLRALLSSVGLRPGGIPVLQAVRAYGYVAWSSAVRGDRYR